MKKLLPFIFLLLSKLGLYAQTVLENNPPSLKWYQVNTPNFRVLFPKGFEVQGQRVANTLEHIRIKEAQTMGVPPRKISIILQNQSAVSNGFVSILPRRSEFYAMPAQDYNFAGTNDWLNLLMSHEYRHIVQYQHATRGFNKLFYYLFGATTLAGMSQAAAPDWFWEGDAVATETAFTQSGRGRIPNFGLVFKTNLLEGRAFNYHKQYLRSYKHNIPNEYVLGFYMTSYLRKRTNDPDIWEKITARAWSVPFAPFAFSNAIKKESGLYVTGLYREMVKDFRQEWEKELGTLTFTPFETLKVPRKKAYTDYLYPQDMEDGSLLVMKQGIGDVEQFVLIKDGKERKIFTPGYMNDSGMLSATDSKIVWNEYGYHPRYAVKNYSLVKMLTWTKKRRPEFLVIMSGSLLKREKISAKRKVIGSKRERFGSAALSADGSKVVTVRTGTDYKTQLVVLDVASGKKLKEYENPENYFFAMPRWSSGGNQIAVLKTTSQGKTISLVEYESGRMTDVLPVTQENVGHPVPFGDYIFYNSPVTGIDNIYAVRIATGERYQITSSRYGAYNPSISKDGKSIFYNDQTRNGLDVVRINFDTASWKSVTPAAPAVEFYRHLVEQEGNTDLFTTIPQETFPVGKYSKLKGIFNPYTWGLNVDTDLTSATIGLSSRDILSTTSVNLGYVFDINERTGAYQAQVSYQGWFPIIDVTGTIADRSVNEGNLRYNKIVIRPSTGITDTVLVEENLTFKWQETTVEAGLRIPLITTSSRFNSNISFANYIGYTAISNFTNSISDGERIVLYNPDSSSYYFFRSYLNDGNLIFNHFSVSAYRLMKQSRRDINSKWGQRILIHNYMTPFGGDFSGSQFSAYAIGYFPGLLKHHSLWGYYGYQKTQRDRENIRTGEGLDNYIFRNQVPLPRGQSISRFQDFYTMSANYTFPIWYPDIALGPLLNIQRLRANLFFDYGFGQSKDFNESRSYSSAGVEAKLDINILRFLPQIDIGVRYTKGLDPSTSEFELLIGTFNF